MLLHSGLELSQWICRAHPSLKQRYVVFIFSVSSVCVYSVCVCACVHACIYVHVCVHLWTSGYLHICWYPWKAQIELGALPNVTSNLFIRIVSLNQTQSSSICLILLSTLPWRSFVFYLLRLWLQVPIYVISGAPNSSPPSPGAYL